MRYILLTFAITGLAVGCTHRSLQKAAIRQTGTINEMYLQQVVDNLAMFQANPSVLPQFATIADGTSQLQDSGTAGNTTSWVPKGFSTNALNFQANRVLMGNWKLTPTIAMASRLRRMRCAFQIVTSDYPIGFERQNGGFTLKPMENDVGYGILCVREMQDFGLLPKPMAKDGAISLNPENNIATFDTLENANAFEERFQIALTKYFPRCWYNVCKRKDVPKSACYVGRHCNMYVWVDSEGSDSLSRFTLTIINIATTDPAPAQAGPTVQVKRNFTIGHENWEVTASVAEKDVNAEIAKLAGAKIAEATAKKTKAESALIAEFEKSFQKMPNKSAIAADLTPEGRGIFAADDLFDSQQLLKVLTDPIHSKDAKLLKSKIDSASFNVLVDAYSEARATETAAINAIGPAIFTSSPATVTDPFNRTPSLPLSQSRPGIEFTATPPPAQ